MPQLKTETLNLRVTPDLKHLIRGAADRQHRTISNFVEALVREHCEREGLTRPVRARTASQERGVRVGAKA